MMTKAKENPGIIWPVRFQKFVKDILKYTPFLKMVIILVALWMVFSAGI